MELERNFRSRAWFNVVCRGIGERAQETVEDPAEQRRAELDAKQSAGSGNFHARPQAGRVFVNLGDDFVSLHPDDLAQQTLLADANRLAQPKRSERMCPQYGSADPADARDAHCSCAR